MSLKEKTYLTVVLIPHHGGGMISIRIPHWLAATVLGLGAFLLLGLGLVTTGYVNKFVDISMLKKMEIENRILRGKLAEFDRKSRDLQASIERFVDFDTKLRVMAGLQPIDPDIRQVGVGGYERSPLMRDITHQSATQLQAVEQNMDKLLRETRLQGESFDEVVASLQEQRKRWDRTPSIQPSPGWIISPFGFRKDPLVGELRMHEGIDIAGPDGTIIVASADGAVTFVGYRGNYGLCLEIEHGYGIITRYAHCSMVKVEQGQTVNRGQVVALVGQTGRATGPHLHYEVVVNGQPVDPQDYILRSRMF
ncbi:MAG TPA: peptidase M23 [candidate division Zixibacteria bacterium]|jgi:murein DD-endopeptidase MepM/ murein hydrolase activator NlpD|nr:peptidase M23 [candidate division Zixibacteria bacterium]